jgi:hypothetical protein
MDRWVFYQGLTKVPCCQECNVLAGDKVFFWIREKRAYIQKALKERYRKKLRFVVWDEEDLEELGPGLASFVLRGQRESARLELRTSFPAVKTRVTRT